MVETKKPIDEQRKEIQDNKKNAKKKGLFIILPTFIIGAVILFAMFPSVPIWIEFVLILIFLVIMALIIFGVLYFIWANNNILSSFVDEGFVKVVVVGGKFRSFLMNYKGKAMDKDWNIISEALPDAIYKDKSRFGMHIIHPLFFGSIYSHVLSWRKYDPKTKKPVDRREILLQTSVMPYPYYIEATQAEDKNRAPVNILTVVTMQVINPYKALFGITTEWIDVVTPLIQASYVAFTKQTTFSKMIIDSNALGDDLFDYIQKVNAPATISLFEELKEVYGILIISLDVIDVTGGDKETDDAIKANALAALRKEATITNATAKAEQIKIEAEAIMTANVRKTMGVVIGQIASLTGIKEENVPEKLKESDFRKMYEKEIVAAMEFARQTVSADNNGLIQIISGSGNSSGQSGAGGVNSDTLALFAALMKAANLPAVSGQSSASSKSGGQSSQAQSESTKQNPLEEKKLTKEEKRKKFLKDNGLEE
jgi:regulator of protease activity HflC (stomatin/prohibitin superfamily)